MTTLKKFLEDLQTKQIHIVGASGTEGAEIALFLNKHKIPNVVLHDFSQNQTEFQQSFLKSHAQQSPEIQTKKLNQLLNLPYPVQYQDQYLHNIQPNNIVFVPQSWFMHKVNQPLNELKSQITLSTLTELYLQLSPCPIIAITGSNGKSTTTFLTHHLLNQNPTKKTYLTGNDRQAVQILDIIDQIQPNNLIVTEISNRQLLNLEALSPDIAVITNISENHLNEHGSFQNYIDTKAKITINQTSNQHFIFNTDNQYCLEISQKTQAQLHNYGSSNQNQCYYTEEAIFLNQKHLINLSEIPLKGVHNYQNCCAAILAAHLTGLTPDQIIQGLKSFHGLTNRIQQVHKTANFTFYNDRQGTAIDATVQALKALSKPTTIILGGQNKDMNPTPLIDQLNQLNTLTIGIQSPFTEEIKSSLNNYHETKTLTKAIELALEISPTNSNILFSPACEYGPYFNPKPENQDAEMFTEIVKKLC